MLPSRCAAGLVSLAVLLTSLTACANSQTGNNLEQILAADPKLNSDSVTFGSSNNPNRQTDSILPLPSDFPSEIPRYPNAQLKEVIQPTPQSTGESSNQLIAGQLTRWVSSDPSNLIASFFQNEFQANNWDLSQQPTDEQRSTLEARRNGLQVTVSIQPVPAISNDTGGIPPNQSAAGQNPKVATEFVIRYDRNTATQAVAPQPNEPSFIGPVLPPQPKPSTPDINTPVAVTRYEVFTDLNKAPQELRQYVQDLAALGVLPLQPAGSNNQSVLEPNKTISRRDYARWLVAANNKIHNNTPAQQIRLVSETAQPAFQDVTRGNPDFPVIQGLAEAGLIPSPLSGNSTAVLFRPDAPLTREQLLLWKVPIDTRQALPNASVDAVKQTWGFQDAARIDPKALQAVLADFQNSDQSNIRRVFGYTTLFQPKKTVTRAEAAAALWYFGTSGEGLSAKDALQVKNQPQPASTPSEEVGSRE